MTRLRRVVPHLTLTGAIVALGTGGCAPGVALDDPPLDVGRESITPEEDRGTAENVGSVRQALTSKWGLLANPEFEGQPLKGAYFFAGSWFNYHNFYGPEGVGTNQPAYSVYPQDPRHLGWSECPAGNCKVNKDFAVDRMTEVGVNTIVMSSWGTRGTSGWRWRAPMQTSTWAHEELFQAAADSTNLRKRPVVIMPAIESYTGYPEGGLEPFSVGFDLFRYATMSITEPRPPLTDNSLRGQIDDLLDRHVRCAQNASLCTSQTSPTTHPDWIGRWAKVYDHANLPRFAVNLLFTCLPTIPMWTYDDGTLLGASLDRLADLIEVDTGQRVGFTLDPMDSSSGFCPRGLVDASAGPALARSRSILAIQPFRSEEHAVDKSDKGRASRKQAFLRSWVNTGLPVIADLTSGYDGTYAFGEDADAAYGHGDDWRNYQSQLLGSGIKGVSFNAWNGFTEGWVGMVSCGGRWAGAAGACGVASDASQNNWIRANFTFDPRNCDSWQFEGGVAKYHVYGAICRKWYDMGGSFNGPTGPALSSERNGGISRTGEQSRVVDFTAGRIYYHRGQTFEVHGDIYQKYRSFGYEASTLGLPTSDERMTASITALGARANNFEGGRIYYSWRGTYAVYGIIGDTYASGAWESALGVPTTDEQPFTGCSGGRISRFEHGLIYWCPGMTTGTVLRN
ncbi:MAG: Conserved exported protein of unknown function [Labilithrix sp.]|nr:Conserved exported protein of unknown function [Labilithrix sp.]